MNREQDFWLSRAEADGSGGGTIPTVVKFGYSCHGFESNLGNI
jgi:hypothetical protein